MLQKYIGNIFFSKCFNRKSGYFPPTFFLRKQDAKVIAARPFGRQKSYNFSHFTSIYTFSEMLTPINLRSYTHFCKFNSYIKYFYPDILLFYERNTEKKYMIMGIFPGNVLVDLVIELLFYSSNNIYKGKTKIKNDLV